VEEIRRQESDRHTHHGEWGSQVPVVDVARDRLICGFRDRRRGCDGRPAARLRVHDLQLRDASHRPDHQLGGEDFLHVGGYGQRADRVQGA
jgi:hypothetical protein